MIWHLLPHVFACIASGQILLLDVRQDRYFAVPETLAAEVNAWLASEEPCGPPAALATLLRDNGVARPGDPDVGKLRFAEVTIPLAPVPASVPGRLHAADTIRLALGLTRTWLSLKFTPLHKLLASAGCRETARPGEAEMLRARAAAYSRARRHLPIPRNCLLDSLALDQWLGAGGAGRSLVLGVTAHPFAAHCWLQSDIHVLNDSYDRVSRYTPILIL